MKQLIFLTLVLISFKAIGQGDSIYYRIPKEKFITKNDALVYSLTFVSGLAEGFRDALSFHFSTGVQKTFPRIDEQFFNPRISWQNQKSNWFLQTFPAFSDGWHGANAFNHGGNIAAIALSTNDFKGKGKGLRIFKKLAMSMIANRLGFLITYNVIFRDRVN